MKETAMIYAFDAYYQQRITRPALINKLSELGYNETQIKELMTAMQYLRIGLSSED